MSASDLTYPEDLLYHVEHQVWARLGDDGLVTVGITSLGIQLAGEIYMCRPRMPGSVVEQGGSIAVVELAKSIVSVKSPLSGAVRAVNPRLSSAPELVHLDPYGEGWLAQLQPMSLDADRCRLVQGEAVLSAMRRHAWLHRLEQGEG